MKYTFFTTTLLSFIFLISCNTNKPERIDEGVSDNSIRTAQVKEVIQASGYTYLRIIAEGEEHWAAGPKTEIEAGTTILFEKFMVMNNFTSKDLNRTFDRILFMENIIDPEKLASDKEQISDAHGNIQVEETDHEINVEVLEGGITLAELFENAEKYENKKITVSGEVVKFNEAIMNKNWVHVQDGSGDDKVYDLTVTTLEKVNVGDIVNFSGKIVLKKDFGMGYFFEVLMEDGLLVLQ
ncbi:MAG: hypothetical protein HOB88_17720 [Bacteroidetes bacterium]|nr:hypothetical protein [Bacteroidota bacterium]